MSLSRALVDRARVLRREPTAQRVEGTTTFVETTGEWFRCRFIQASIDGEDVQGTRTRVPRTPQLLAGLTTTTGGRVDLRASDRVEVRSAELGHGTWNVNGAPQPLRKRRAMLGWLADLTRVEEP